MRVDSVLGSCQDNVQWNEDQKIGPRDWERLEKVGMRLCVFLSETRDTSSGLGKAPCVTPYNCTSVCSRRLHRVNPNRLFPVVGTENMLIMRSTINLFPRDNINYTSNNFYVIGQWGRLNSATIFSITINNRLVAPP